MKATIKNFLQMESAGGLVLMGAAALALVAANSPLAGYYDLFIETPVEVRIGRLEIAKPLLLWVNDGLMAVFFFLVGLEVKREILWRANCPGRRTCYCRRSALSAASSHRSAYMSCSTTATAWA